MATEWDRMRRNNIINSKDMGIAKEQLYDNQQEAFYESMAECLGITCDEVEEIEPEVNENTGNDGAIYGHYLTFKEDAPRDILDKIEGLDSNDWYWLDISELYDEDYDVEQYKHIVEKKSPYDDCLISIEEATQLLGISLKKEKKSKYVLYRQIYASLISILEAYLFERLLLSIDKDENRLANFFLFHNGAHNFDEHDVKKVRKHLMENILYHNLDNVSRIYTATFKFEFPPYDNIKNAVGLRHDIVHRNGKTTNGYSLIVSRKDIEHLSVDIKDFIRKIEYNICNPSLLFNE